MHCFFKLEKQSFDLALENLKAYHDKHPNVNIFNIVNFEDSKMKFFFRIFNGIFIIYELFSDKEVFMKNMDKVHDLIYHIVKISAEDDESSC